MGDYQCCGGSKAHKSCQFRVQGDCTYEYYCTMKKWRGRVTGGSLLPVVTVTRTATKKDSEEVVRVYREGR
jgi:hypothetical protein